MTKTRVLDGVEYEPGKKFRVLQSCRIRGMRPMPSGGAYAGWSRMLEPGEVVVCDGFGAGWGSDPGYGVHWREPEVSYVTITPEHGGPFAFRPVPGLLEEVPDGEGA